MPMGRVGKGSKERAEEGKERERMEGEGRGGRTHLKLCAFVPIHSMHTTHFPIVPIPPRPGWH